MCLAMSMFDYAQEQRSLINFEHAYAHYAHMGAMLIAPLYEHGFKLVYIIRINGTLDQTWMENVISCMNTIPYHCESFGSVV